MGRLYLRIYFSLVGVLLLFGLLAGAAWRLSPQDAERHRFFDGMGQLLAQGLPEPGAGEAAHQTALEEMGRWLPARLTIRAGDGRLLGAVGEPLPAPTADHNDGGWVHAHGDGPTWALPLSGERWIIIQPRYAKPRGLRFGVALALLALALAVGIYPLARGLVRRLERLQAQVDALGAGDLSARVAVEGRDEVAALAVSFNRAADRIEKLVAGHKELLASASHELRSPLTRLRMGLEMASGAAKPELRQRLARDIAILDDAIGELLLASRLEALAELERTEEVDLLALLAEEAAGLPVSVSGRPVILRGDPRLLRRLIRNLLANALRHAGPATDGPPVEAWVEVPLKGRENAPPEDAMEGAAEGAPPEGREGALLVVADRGPGVAPEERERIFEPYYRPAGMRENADGGVGLGLALVRRIARKHGGDARCLGRDGGGARFEVWIRGQAAPG